MDGKWKGRVGTVLRTGGQLAPPSELPLLYRKPLLSANQCDDRKWASWSAQPLYPIPRQASSSEPGENNPSTHQDPTSKISPRSSYPVGSEKSGSFISLHPLPLAKKWPSVARCPPPPPPQVCKLEGSASVLSVKKVAVLCCGVRALKCPLGCMERE